MELKTTWKNNMHFESKIGDHVISMDAVLPLGHNKGPTPREVMVTTLASATGMDVVGLLKKYKQPVDRFEIETLAETNKDGYPIVFNSIELIYRVEGKVDESMVREAIHLSHSKYCGIFSMLSKAVHIHWRLFLNGREMAEESADSFLSLE